VSAPKEQVEEVIEMLATMGMDPKHAAISAFLVAIMFRNVEAIERQAAELKRIADYVADIAYARVKP
jgi:hypothetical protein